MTAQLLISFLIFGRIVLEPGGFPHADVTHVSVAPDEGVVLIATSNPPCIAGLIDARAAFSLALPHNVMKISELGWSFDSKYFSVTLETGDLSQYGVYTIDDTNGKLQSVHYGLGGGVTWLPESHRLLIVPNFGIDELPSTPGMILLDIDSLQQEMILTDYYFWGRHSVAGSTLVAQGIQYDAHGKPSFSLIRYDLQADKIVEEKNGATSSIGGSCAENLEPRP